MTDPIEDRLRSHLAARADGVHARPDPDAFVERSANRGPRRGLVAGGLAALTVVVAGAGVLTGVNLSGASASPPTSAPAPSSTGSGRNGAALAPNGAAASPSIVVPSSYSFLFTRVSANGVTVRAYTSTPSPSDGCAPAPGCSPSTTIPGSPPCPMGAMCAQPIVVPHTSGGTGGSSGSASSGPATVVGPNRPADAGGGTVTTVPEPSPVATCGQLLVELSTDRAVGTGSLTQPISPLSAQDAVVVLGSGSFGLVEGAPVSWVAVSVGGEIATVRLTSGGTPLDAMAPVSGVVVLTATGGSGLAGASLVGVDQSGATVATTPAVQSAPPGDAGGCPPTTPPPTAPPPTVPATTTTTTAPPTTTTTTAPPTTTTTGPPPTGPPVGTGG